eukprot:403364139
MTQQVDNTGNVRVWPSEEILAYYIYQHKELLNKIMQSDRIIELGAGQSGLIGFMLSMINKEANNLQIDITDGNSKCVESKKIIIHQFLYSFDQTL